MHAQTLFRDLHAIAAYSDMCGNIQRSHREEKKNCTPKVSPVLVTVYV